MLNLKKYVDRESFKTTPPLGLEPLHTEESPVLFSPDSGHPSSMSLCLKLRQISRSQQDDVFPIWTFYHSGEWQT